MDGEPRSERPIGRRRFLGLMLGAAAAGATAYVGIDQGRRHGAVEAVQGVPGFINRKNPEKVEPKIVNPTEAALNQCYDRFFQGKEHLLPRKAWVRTIDEGDKKRVEGLGNNIASLAYLYYDKEKNPGETVDQYFERFMTQLSERSQIAGMDFITLVASLQVSGENTRDLGEQKVDVTISGIQQVGIPAGRAVGADYFAQEALRPGKQFDQLKNTSLGKYLPNMPIESRDINATIRFQSERTIGMMDWEPSMRAQALLLFGTDAVKSEFVKKYPDLVRAYQDILVKQGVPFSPIIDEKGYKELQEKQTDSLKKSKHDLEKLAREYINTYKGHLDTFAHDQNSLSQIGLGEPVDLWQKYNKTDFWNRMVHHTDKQDPQQTDEKIALSEVKAQMKEDFDKRREHYYFQLMSQQILNPKFLPFLLERAKKSNSNFEVSTLQKLMDGVGRYETQAHQVRERFLHAEALEGPLEYNAAFQTLATATTTKMLSEQAGPFDPNDKDSLYWHIFRTVAIREISHPLLVVQESGFAPDITVDPPYVVDKTMESLGRLEELMQEKKILQQPAWKNMSSFMQAYNALRDRNYAVFPELSEEDRKQVESYFANRIVDTPHIAMNRSQSVVWNLVSHQAA